MSFSKIFEAVEDNRRELLNEINHALDVIKTGNLGDFENNEEMIKQIERSLLNILNISSR